MNFIQRHPRLWLSCYAIGFVVFLLIYVGAQQARPIKPSIADERTDVQADALANEHRHFHGYVCSDDCSGHRAGYDWAERKGITLEDDCPDDSNSFFEGCLAYIEASADLN